MQTEQTGYLLIFLSENAVVGCFLLGRARIENSLLLFDGQIFTRGLEPLFAFILRKIETRRSNISFGKNLTLYYEDGFLLLIPYVWNTKNLTKREKCSPVNTLPQ